MDKKDRKDIRNGVIYTLIASAILAIIQYLGFPVLSWAWNIIKAVFHFFVSSITLPIWLIMVLVIGVWPVLLFVIIKFHNLLDAEPLPQNFNNNTRNRVESYTQDSFFNAIWRWTWGKNGIDNLLPYCPRCDMNLMYNEGITGRSTSLECDNCGYHTSHHSGDFRHMINRVENHIARKLRSNEWMHTSTGAKSAELR